MVRTKQDLGPPVNYLNKYKIICLKDHQAVRFKDDFLKTKALIILFFKERAWRRVQNLIMLLSTWLGLMLIILERLKIVFWSKTKNLRKRQQNLLKNRRRTIKKIQEITIIIYPLLEKYSVWIIFSLAPFIQAYWCEKISTR